MANQETEIALQLDKWAEINEDMLNEIVQCIDSYVDYARFRSTCKNWYLKLLKFPKHIKLPLLLLPIKDEGELLCSLYHPEERKVIGRLPSLEIQNTAIHGSCYEWLIMIGLDDTIQIMNPFTRARIQLPPLSTFPGIVSYQPYRHGEEYTFKTPPHTKETLLTYDRLYMQNIYVNKIILSSPPDDDQDFIAVAMYSYGHYLCFCRSGDKVWTNIVENLDHKRGYFFDVIFHKEKICVVNACGSIYECDMMTSKGELILSRRPSCDDYIDDSQFKYLVQSGSGALLLVIRYVDLSEEPEASEIYDYRTTGFDIFKLDELQDKWLKVQSLDDYVLVVGYNSSICVLPHIIPGNKGNRIYYSDDVTEFQDFETFTKGGHDNGVFYLEDRSIHQLLPNLPIWPNPIWLCGNEREIVATEPTFRATGSSYTN